MMSIGFVSAGGGRYYTEMAREDYYLSGGESPGEWYANKAAIDFGVSGLVERSQLENLFDGYDITGSNEVGQNAGKVNRRAAIDLCFSVPKDYSTLWAVAEEAERLRLEAAFHRAVDKTLEFIDRECGYTRRGKEGRESEKVDLLIAKFTHRSSRAQDPQLHQHALVLNACKRASDGSFGTIDAGYLLAIKMTAGAYFRSALAREIDIPLERDPKAKFSFRVPGVSEALSDHWSSRSKAIDEEVKKHGVAGTLAKAYAALSTRIQKGHRALEELKWEWGKKAAEYGFTSRDVERILGRKRESLTPEQERSAIDGAIKEGVKQLTKQDAHFSRNHLIRETCIATVERGIDPKTITQRIDETLKTREYVLLDADKKRYTTHEIFVEIEGKALENAKALGLKTSRCLGERAVEEALNGSAKALNPGQRDAAARIMTGPDLVVIQGPPGSGKTTMLKVANDALVKSGGTVIGLSPSNRAARELEASSGIPSITLDRFLYDQERTVGDNAKHHAKMVVRTALGLATWKLPKKAIDHRTTIVVDECSMAENSKLARVLEVVRRTGCRVAMLGDQQQLPSIGQGGLFRDLYERAKPEQKAALTEIVRQRADWTKEAIQKIGKGETAQALKAYKDRGFLEVLPTRDEAQQQLVKRWRLFGAENPESHLILAATNKEVSSLNQQAQEIRRKGGKLGWSHVTVDGEKIHEGDRVLFTDNRKDYGILKSDFGTVKKVDVLHRRLTVAIDGAKEPVTFSLWKFDSVRLGYAATVHRAQGMTLEQDAYILFGGTMQSREMTYVQMSRAKGNSHLFADEATTPEMRDIERQANRSIEKRSAHGMAQESAQTQPQPEPAPQQQTQSLSLNLSL